MFVLRSKSVYRVYTLPWMREPDPADQETRQAVEVKNLILKMLTSLHMYIVNYMTTHVHDYIQGVHKKLKVTLEGYSTP